MRATLAWAAAAQAQTRLRRSVDGMIYTLVATPTSNINVGVLTVTVAADAATAATSTGTKLHKNIETMWTQEYDTLAPVVPTFDIVATDNIINAARANRRTDRHDRSCHHRDPCASAARTMRVTAVRAGG